METGGEEGRKEGRTSENTTGHLTPRECITWAHLCLHHEASSVPQGPDKAEDVNNVLSLDLPQLGVQSDECASPTNTSTAKEHYEVLCMYTYNMLVQRR